MKWTIEKTVELKASPARVWKALSDPAELTRWFPDRAELALEEGARGTLTWENHGTATMEVLEVEPLRRFVWRWSGNDQRSIDEYSTRVEWTLTARADGGTTLHVRESGFDSEKHFQQNTGGWDAELAELTELLGSD
ncbi:MAG: SRPBCC domain-containing protein [Gemmatimonadota bacterium]